MSDSDHKRIERPLPAGAPSALTAASFIRTVGR
jgi:hypothetical protein